MYKYNFETYKLNESQIDSVQRYAEYHANAQIYKRGFEGKNIGPKLKKRFSDKYERNVFLKVLEADLLGIAVTDTERKIYNNIYGEFN